MPRRARVLGLDQGLPRQRRPPFTEDDLELLAAVGPGLGSALRRGIDGAATAADVPPSAPGVIVLDRDLRAVGWTGGARSWAESLPAASLFAAWGMLPAVVYPERHWPGQSRAANETQALQRAVDGRWVKIEAAPLAGDKDGRIAVVFRAAAPAETFELLCRAYALTTRERQVVTEILAGADTHRSPSASRSHATPCKTTSSQSSRRSASAAGAN